MATGVDRPAAGTERSTIKAGAAVWFLKPEVLMALKIRNRRLPPRETEAALVNVTVFERNEQAQLPTCLRMPASYLVPTICR